MPPRPSGARRVCAARRVRQAAGAILLVLSAGCAAPRLLSFEGGASPAALRVVVAPLNLAVALAPDLEDSVAPVGWQIIHHLRARGSAVAVLAAPDAGALWQDTVLALRSAEVAPPDLRLAAAAFTEALAKQADFDLLVLPSLVYRPARVTGHYARWDGVRRRLSLVERPEPGAGPGDWRGSVSGLSLHVLVYEPDGRCVSEGWGGLDLVHDAVSARSAPSASHFLRLQAEPLANPEHVREGVALALDRWPEPALP